MSLAFTKCSQFLCKQPVKKRKKDLETENRLAYGKIAAEHRAELEIVHLISNLKISDLHRSDPS